MTLRTRTLIASGVALVALVLMGLVLLAQYTLTAATEHRAADGRCRPPSDSTATLALEQSNASGALADYIMLSREASLDDYRQTIGRATTLLDELKDDARRRRRAHRRSSAAARAAQRGWVKTDAEPSITLMEAGKRTRAIKETSSPESWAAYDAMTAATGALHQSLNDTRDEAADAVRPSRALLGISLLGVGLIVLVGTRRLLRAACSRGCSRRCGACATTSSGPPASPAT